MGMHLITKLVVVADVKAVKAARDPTLSDYTHQVSYRTGSHLEVLAPHSPEPTRCLSQGPTLC